MIEEQIILVDSADKELGFMPKMEVHQKGLLHRAFSIFVFNSKGQMLIQQRALSKYHSAGLWTNTCCSHPLAGETAEEAVHRRLKQEMGFDCKLDFVFKFEYLTALENDLIENELDHVYIGSYDQNPVPNPEEVAGYRWIEEEQLKKEIKEFPENFTYWFKQILQNYTNEFGFPEINKEQS